MHEDFYERVKSLEDVAKECKVHIYVKGSYYQLPNPSQQVLVSDADLVIGHGFQFEVRNENNALLCNKICLSKSKLSLKNLLNTRVFLSFSSNGYVGSEMFIARCR